MTKSKKMEVIVQALSKLPRVTLRTSLRKMKLPTGKNKVNSVNNLAKALV